MADLGSAPSKRMWCSVPERMQLHLAMLALQFGYAGFHVISRAALNMGVSKLVFPVYRNIIALLLLLPFAYFLEKLEGEASHDFKLRRPVLSSGTRRDYSKPRFLLAWVGQHIPYLRISNTELCASHYIPHGSHIKAIESNNTRYNINGYIWKFRIEQVRLNRKDGLAKVAGTVLCVAGATVITLYKGPTIYSPTTRVNNSMIMNRSNTTVITPMFDFGSLSLGDAKGKNWTLGCLYLIGHCLSWSGWLVLQAPVLKKYPARLSVTSYTCFFGILQFLVIALLLERDAQAWLFHSAGEVFTILYAGVVASGIAFAVQIWCIDRGGPVFVAVYQPVQTFVVAIMASIALGEEFYLGGIIGAVLIVAGLYFVLWGKSEERKFAMEQLAIASTEHNSIASHVKASIAQPLLSSSTENV
ncbi:Protein WALLS ARE THIN 1 [Glycine soja]